MDIALIRIRKIDRQVRGFVFKEKRKEGVNK